MNKKYFFLDILKESIIFIIFGFFIYIFFDSSTIGIMCASLALNSWFLYNFFMFSGWLHKKTENVPSSIGVWEKIFILLHRKNVRNQKRKKELTRLIRRFKSGSESLPDGVLVFKKRGVIVWCNSLAEELLGLRFPADLGQNIKQIIRTPEFINYLNSNNFDKPVEMPSPVLRTHTLELRMMQYNEGEFLMIIRDTTQIKQLEDMKRTFFADASHELRTPMTVLKGYLEVSKNPEEIGDMWQRAHKVMSEQLIRMESLVEQLLTLSKLESDNDIDLNDDINLVKMLNQIEIEAMSLAKTKKQNLDFNVDKNIRVKGNEEQFRSVVTNLIFNAIKHNPNGIDVRVNLKKFNEGIMFEVIDTGRGIEQNHIERLTERFYRVDKARSRATGGSGLGLAIVKYSLNHYDTSLKIESKINEGSKFYFIIDAKFVLSQ